jgi:hypothetical protein
MLWFLGILCLILGFVFALWEVPKDFLNSLEWFVAAIAFFVADQSPPFEMPWRRRQ